VARQLSHVLDERDLRANGTSGKERFWTSGDPKRSQRVMSALLGRPVKVEKLPEP
jgi:glutamate racemase